MISQTDLTDSPSHAPTARHGAEAGFTLIEIVVVLAVLGLITGLLLYRGQPRSPTLDLQAATRDVAGILRVARTRAIASNRPISVIFDMRDRSIRVDGAAPRALPARLGISVAGTGRQGAPAQAGIRFAPDGSSSGGRVELVEGERRQLIGVDWLTGRVSIAGPP